jgi:hypothetical protein
MTIRVGGTETEIAAVERLATALDVQEASRFYGNRGSSVLGRVYLTIAAPSATPVIHAEVERANEPNQLRNRKEIR